MTCRYKNSYYFETEVPYYVDDSVRTRIEVDAARASFWRYWSSGVCVEVVVVCVSDTLATIAVGSSLGVAMLR